MVDCVPCPYPFEFPVSWVLSHRIAMTGYSYLYMYVYIYYIFIAIIIISVLLVLLLFLLLLLLLCIFVPCVSLQSRVILKFRAYPTFFG